MRLSSDVGRMMLVGGLPLAFAVWCWRGRSAASRWWVGNPLNERIVRGAIPAWSIMFTPIGFVGLVEGSSYEALVESILTPVIFFGCFTAFWTIAFLPIPRWWAPGWHRRAPTQAGFGETRSALGALMVAASRRREVEPAETAAGGARQVASWRGSFVYDVDSGVRAHGLAGRGSVEGRLILDDQSVMFESTATENALRGGPVNVTIHRPDITDVRVVPARAGADGIARRGFFYRSLLSRLVVETDAEAYVFEVNRARLAADSIWGPNRDPQAS